ncbi:MAG: response regulator, partial [Verrucomicrobia bacterium]|nr:response regulator [Verrucomicrobiota bacterium]
MSGSKNQGGRSILVVDDEDRLRLLVRKILEVAHYEVSEAATATDALKKLLAFQPDLILLDFILPDMTGLLLLNVIRSKEELASVPVVFLTGTNDSVTKATALEGGAVDYVTKPFDRLELLARIARHIEMKDEREEQARKAADAAA